MRNGNLADLAFIYVHGYVAKRIYYKGARDDCAEYLRMDKKTFQQYYACNPNFPKRIHLERSEGRGKTLWRAQEIVDWAVKNRRGKL